jgi:hypothetical protein
MSGRMMVPIAKETPVHATPALDEGFELGLLFELCIDQPGQTRQLGLLFELCIDQPGQTRQTSVTLDLESSALGLDLPSCLP